jgi:hypothetical protein
MANYAIGSAIDQYICPHCDLKCAHESSLNRHINNSCKVAPTREELIGHLDTVNAYVKTLETHYESLKDDHTKLSNTFHSGIEDYRKLMMATNQECKDLRLQVCAVTNYKDLRHMCFNCDDNLFYLVISDMGLEDGRLSIKECGLFGLAGDCQLLTR